MIPDMIPETMIPSSKIPPRNPLRGGYILFISLFCLILFGFGLGLFLLPQSEFSESENRVLETLPVPDAEDILDGSWQSRFESFASDQLPLRDALTAIGSSLRYLWGEREIGGALVGEDEDGKIRLFEAISQSDLRAETAEENVTYIEEFAARHPELSVTVMLAPSAAMVYEESLPLSAPLYDGEAVFAAARAKLSSCTVPDLLAHLRAAKAGGSDSLYYRTDHHWSTDGAAIAAEVYLMSLLKEREPVTTQTVGRDFYGTLHSKVLLPFLEGDSVDVSTEDLSHLTVLCGSGREGEPLTEIPLYDPSKLLEKDQYQLFFGGNYGYVEIQNPRAEREDTLLLIKDSFANAFAPLVASHYRRIVMVDLRYYLGRVETLLEKEASLSQVLFLYEVDNFVRDRNLLKLRLGIKN